MSTPRLPAPRSSAAPITATGSSCCTGIRARLALRAMSAETPGAGRIRVVLADDDVVFDLHMPLLDGVTAVARMRRDHPSLCLIALTGDEAPALHRAVEEAGADAVLQKDEFVQTLLDRLHQVAEGS